MAWRGTWYLVRKCWRSFRGLFLFSSEPGFLRKTLCCKLTWELRRHLRRYNNEAKWGQWGFTQHTWQWLTLVSSPTPTLLFCVVRNGALIHLCLLIHILWRKKLGLPPGLPSSKSGDPSQHRLCRMGAQSVHRPDHQDPLQQGHRRSRILEEQSSCVCSRSGEPLKPGQDPRKAMDGPSWVFYLIHSEENAAVHESLSAMRQWPLHDMWLPRSIKQKEKKNKGAGETGLVLFLALTLLHFSQKSVRIWNVSLLNQKANESNQAPETANPKSQHVRQSQREANPPLHMMEPLPGILWFSQGGPPGSTKREWGQGGWNRGLLKQLQGTFLQACLIKGCVHDLAVIPTASGLIEFYIRKI